MNNGFRGFTKYGDLHRGTNKALPKFKIKTMIHNIKQLVTIIVFLSLLVAVLMYGDMR
jgi:hypothetical protein